MFVLYYNSRFIESVWVPPKDGFLSLSEQKEHVNKEWLQQIKEVQKKNRVQEVLLEQEKKKDEEEERARLAREKLKERRVVDDIPPVTYAPLIPEGKNDPYGRWQTVKTEYVLRIIMCMIMLIQKFDVLGHQWICSSHNSNTLRCL